MIEDIHTETPRRPGGMLRRAGWLLLAGFTLLFFLMHLRSIGWSPGLFHDYPRVYWALVEWLVGPDQLYAAANTGVSILHHGLLGLLFVALSAVYFFAIVRTRQRVEAISLRSLLRWTAAFCVPLLILPNIFSGDIYSYVIFGRIAGVHGGNPFADAPALYAADPYLQYVYWRTTPSVYGPGWMLLSHLLTVGVEVLGGGLWLYQLAYKLLAVGLHMANIGLIWSILGRWKPQQQGWGTLLYAWNPLLLLEFGGSGHNDVLMITLLLLMLWLHLRGRIYPALAALVAAVLVKWVVVALLPLYALLVLRQTVGWAARARRIGAGLAVTAAVVVFAYAPYWTGFKTLEILASAPPSTRTVNSLADMVLNERQRTRNVERMSLALPRQGSLSAALPKRLPVRPGAEADDVVLILEGERAESRELLTDLHNQYVAQRNADNQRGFRLAGNLALLLIWLWWVWRIRDLEQLLRAWSWILFVYLAFTSVWFWPWYVTWFVALAALIDWRRAALTAIIFSCSAMLLYAFFIPTPSPIWVTRFRAIPMFAPPLLYLGWTWVVQLRSFFKRRGEVELLAEPELPDLSSELAAG